MRIIFVAGIHGVGKTTGCKSVAEEFGIPHFSASQIIKGERSSAVDEMSKLVADVDDNQRLLIRGVLRVLERGRFLLDGHFTMRRKSDGGIEAIHVDVFRELNIGGVVLYTDHPEEISRRILARDGVSQPVDMLRSHQDAEVAHAKYVTATLSIPLVILQAFDIVGTTNAVREWTV
jgi:adenylate kinase